MDIDETVLRVQCAYPQIYLACHSRHQNSRTTPDKLSQRDASLLAHLDERHPVSQGDLAHHMGVAKSTLSEALSNLKEKKLPPREPDDQDGRGALIRRTRKGTEAMSRGSVLEPERLRELLGLLTEQERTRAVEGIELIACAATRMQ